MPNRVGSVLHHNCWDESWGCWTSFLLWSNYHIIFFSYSNQMHDKLVSFLWLMWHLQRHLPVAVTPPSVRRRMLFKRARLSPACLLMRYLISLLCQTRMWLMRVTLCWMQNRHRTVAVGHDQVIFSLFLRNKTVVYSTHQAIKIIIGALKEIVTLVQICSSNTDQSWSHANCAESVKQTRIYLDFRFFKVHFLLQLHEVVSWTAFRWQLCCSRPLNAFETISCAVKLQLSDVLIQELLSWVKENGRPSLFWKYPHVQRRRPSNVMMRWNQQTISTEKDGA